MKCWYFALELWNFGRIMVPFEGSHPWIYGDGSHMVKSVTKKQQCYTTDKENRDKIIILLLKKTTPKGSMYYIFRYLLLA